MAVSPVVPPRPRALAPPAAGSPRSLQPPLLPPQVLFKLLLGSAKFGEAALFLSVLGVFNVLFISCVPVILYFTGVEYWSPFADIPWGNLCGFSGLLLSKFRFPARFPGAVTERDPRSSGAPWQPVPIPGFPHLPRGPVPRGRAFVTRTLDSNPRTTVAAVAPWSPLL